MQKCIETCLDMLNKRSYTIIEREDDKIITVDYLDNKILVLFSLVSKLNINIMKEYIKLVESMSIKHLILIYSGVMTSSARKVIENLFHLRVELFTEQELKFNITTHRYYCKHVKVDNPEIKKKFGLKIPVLLQTDPVVRFFGFQRGDLIEVTRRDHFVTYRMVK